jgi:hypothetical protein
MSLDEKENIEKIEVLLQDIEIGDIMSEMEKIIKL